MIGDATLIDDRSLLEHYARTRDAKAFNELARRYAGLVYGTCLRVTQNRDDAEDVAQECFLELARKAGTVRSSLAGWLHRVAKTRSINAIKRDSALRTREQRAFDESPAETASEWAEIEPLVDAAVERLPDHLRVPVVLHYFQGLEQTQIAYSLQINQSTVSRRLDKAVDALRKELQRAGVVVSVAALGVLLGGKASTAAPAALTAALGKMAITGPGSAALAHSMITIPQITAKQVFGTLAGKLAVGALVGVIAFTIAYKSTRVENDTAYAAPPVVAQAPTAVPAAKAQVAVTPMETYRGDPFAPVGYRATVNGAKAHANAPVTDLPMPRAVRPASGGGLGMAGSVPPPVQPSRRMTGLVMNNGICAIIESNGKSELVVPGQMLSDGLATVQRIENNRVILKTTGSNPVDVVAGLTPAPSVGQTNPPAPGIQPPSAAPRPIMAPGMPAMRPAVGVPYQPARLGAPGMALPMAVRSRPAMAPSLPMMRPRAVGVP